MCVGSAATGFSKAFFSTRGKNMTARKTAANVAAAVIGLGNQPRRDSLSSNRARTFGKSEGGTGSLAIALRAESMAQNNSACCA
jgi:hypothetical protein